MNSPVLASPSETKAVLLILLGCWAYLAVVHWLRRRLATRISKRSWLDDALPTDETPDHRRRP